MNKRLVLAVFGLLMVWTTFGAERDVVTNASAVKMVHVDDSLSNAKMTFQLNLLQKALQSNERRADSWWKTWTTIYAAATIGQGVVALTTRQKSLKQDLILGVGTTLLGMANQLLTPVKTGFRPIETDSISILSASDKIQLRAQGEEYLKKQVQIAQAGKGWQVHALSGAVNLASGLITWIGFNRSFGEGVFNFALNTVITETQIWTQPVRAKQDLERYLQAKDLGFEPSTKLSPEWYGLVTATSCRFGVRF